MKRAPGYSEAKERGIAAESVERRRKALQELTKDDLVEIVLRLQDQLRDSRTMVRMSLEDGIAEGRRAARAESEELAPARAGGVQA